MGWVGIGRREKGAREIVTKRKRGKEKVRQGRGQGPLAKEGGLCLDIFAGVPEFLDTRYVTDNRAGLPT